MAISSFLQFTNGGASFQSAIQVFEKEGMFEVFCFDHNVSTENGEYDSTDPLRQHGSLVFQKKVDQLTPLMYQALSRGDAIEELQIRWYQYRKDQKKQVEYFRHILNDVTVVGVRQILPSVKNPKFEKFKAIEEVSLRYNRITWHYLDGNIMYWDEWNRNNGADNDIVEEEQFVAAQPAKQKKVAKNVRLLSGKFIKPGQGFKFNEACKVQVKAELPPESKKKIQISLYSKYQDVVEDMKSKADGFLNDGVAEAELKLFHNNKYYYDESSDKKPVEYYFLATHPEASNSLESEHLLMPQQDKKKACFVEMPDVLFNTNSAVPCLDKEGSLLGALAAAYKQAGENPSQEMVVFGHTDTSGELAYNYDLSELRSISIKSLLEGNASAWSEVVGKKSNTLDYQCILSSLTESYGWNCDPGKTDGADGPKTKEGVKGFQLEFNNRHKGDLKPDGIVGPKTWGAIFDVYQFFLKDVYGEQPPKLNFGYKGEGIYPCGESFPIEGKGKDGYVSKTNRRVEVIFWEAADAPELLGHSDKNTRVTSEECPVYDDSQWDKDPIKGDKKLPIIENPEIEFVFPSSAAHIQYVNQASNGKEMGDVITLVVKSKNESDNIEIEWKVKAHKDNSKRTKPEKGFLDPNSKKVNPLKNGEGIAKSTVKNGQSEMSLSLGLAGGDVYEVEAKPVGGKSAIKVSITNWRKLWYQLTHHKDLIPPSMKTSEKIFRENFIEFLSESAATHNEYPNGSVRIGNHNAKKFHDMLSTTHKGQCVNIILCDEQYDGLDGAGNVLTSGTDEFFEKNSGVIEIDEDSREVIDPPIQTGSKLIVNCWWKNAKTGKSGTLSQDAKNANDNVGTITFQGSNKFKVDLPKNATPSKQQPVQIHLVVTVASGPWGGDGGTPPHNLIVIDNNDTIHSQCVAHEVGHLINMVPGKNAYGFPSGFSASDHKDQYTGMGGSGSHCSWEIDKSTSTASHNDDGKCIMFHQLNYNCKLVFCPSCKPIVMAQSIKKLGEL